MISSEHDFRTPGRALAVGIASLALAAGICWPYASPAAASEGPAAAYEGFDPEAAANQQAQAGGLKDPERDRDRPERHRQARLTLLPPVATVAAGDRLVMRVVVSGVEELLRLPATVRFDPRVLRVVSVRVGGAWKGGTAPTLMFDTSRAGRIVVGLARMGRDAQPLTGGGEVLRITFEALAEGESDIDLERFALLGRGARSQKVVARAAKVSVQ